VGTVVAGIESHRATVNGLAPEKGALCKEHLFMQVVDDWQENLKLGAVFSGCGPAMIILSRLRGGTRDTAWKKLSGTWCKEERAESLRTPRPHNPLVLRARF
jgi:hypothetical protein